MGLLDSLRAAMGRGTRYEQVVYSGPTVTDVLGMGPDALFRTQPHLRTVITFVARNVAQLPLHMFERISDTDRQRVKDDPVARLLSRPNPDMTGYELIYALVADMKLYDVGIWLTLPDPGAASGWTIWPIPPSWVSRTGGGSAWGPDWIEILRPGETERTIINRDRFLIFHGYRPGDPSRGVSPVESLKEILAEQIQAWSYRQQIWQRGGRVGAYLTRPAEAPEWSKEARQKFQRDWSSKWTGRDGPKAGGTPILEDGLELKRLGFSAREDEWSEVAKLSLSTVAAVYHTNPTMVGILDNANFSNVKEFKQMLYTDTLGPDLEMIQARINTFLIPRVTEREDLYVEFNIQAKLAGSFEEQAAVMSTAIGRPWMTANEARARFNMPALAGDADALVTPLNVLIGGQASPRDSGSQNLNSGGVRLKGDGKSVSVKAEGREEDALTLEHVLVKFFKRQRSVVLTQLGAKADEDWWDEDRWDDELAQDLLKFFLPITQDVATETLDALGIDPDTYSAARTTAFLKAVAASRASMINSTTLDQLRAALAGDLEDEAEGSTPAGVFDLAETSRSEQSGTTLATTLAAFAVTEAAKQMNRPRTTKTWIVTSGNPRASHAAMAGETVGIDDVFSNGLNWPGDPVNGPDEVAGCECAVEVTVS